MTYEYFLNRAMDELFDTTTHTYYLGLSTTDPSVAITEPSTGDTGYARVAIAGFSAASEGSVSNSSPILFPQTLAAWGTITHYVVFDAATDGNPLFSEALEAERPMTGADMQLVFGAGELVLTLSDAVAN